MNPPPIQQPIPLPQEPAMIRYQLSSNMHPMAAWPQNPPPPAAQQSMPKEMKLTQRIPLNRTARIAVRSPKPVPQPDAVAATAVS